MRRKNKPPLPPRYRWPRRNQPQSARKACPHCGQLDEAVSTREQITYYGPSTCSGCGVRRPLRKVERPIDIVELKRRYAIPRDYDWRKVA